MHIDTTILELELIKDQVENPRAIDTAIKSLQLWSELRDRIDKLDWYDDKPGVDAKILVYDAIGTIDTCTDIISRV